MNIYQVSYRDDCDEHKGYSYHATRREARKTIKTAEHAEQTCDVEKVTVSVTKAGILKALQRFASHPDNG